MAEETEKEFMGSLDRRIMDHDSKLSSIQRDYVEVNHEIKEVLNRINGGLSPSVNEVRKENGEIKMAIKDLSHQIQIDQREMKDMVKETTEHTRLMIDNFDKHKLAPVIEEVGFIKKTFVYGIVGAILVFIGQKGINILWEKVFIKDAPVISSK